LDIRANPSGGFRGVGDYRETMAGDDTEEAVKTLMDLAHYATSDTAHASFFPSTGWSCRY